MDEVSWHMPAKQTLGPQQQDQQHRKKQDEIGEFGQQRLTEIIDEPDDDAADKRPEETACSAQNDYDERERQHILIETGINREDRGSDDARERGQSGAKRKHDGEQLRYADADHARHVGIVNTGTYHGAQSGALKKQPKRGGDHGRDNNDRQPIIREDQNAKTRKSGELRGCCHGKRIATPHDETEISRHEGQAERHQNLGELISRQPAEQQAFSERTQKSNRKSSQHRSKPEIQFYAEHADYEGGANVSAQHKERPVRQVWNPHQAE